jgi:signal recognition particle subunit SEC65
MQVKEVKKLITNEGGVAMRREELDKILRSLGFEKLEETVKSYGKFWWQVCYGDYEVEIEPNERINQLGYKEHISNEGAEKVIEMTYVIENSEIRYTVEVYRIIKFDVYIVHVFTGFDEKYFFVRVLDNVECKEIAKLEVHGGFIYCGSQSDLAKVLPQLIQAIKPVEIKVY